MKGGIGMMTFLFFSFLIWVVAKLLWLAVKASWTITKTLLACFVLPIVIVVLLALNLDRLVAILSLTIGVGLLFANPA